MTYAPPSGWIETVSGYDESGAERTRFHRRSDCPRIREPDTLRPVDRPYSSPRCTLCAPDANSRIPQRPVGRTDDL
jgi:hypothetical protein